MRGNVGTIKKEYVEIMSGDKRFKIYFGDEEDYNYWVDQGIYISDSIEVDYENKKIIKIYFWGQ